MLEVGQQSALQAGSVRVAGKNQSGETGYQAIGNAVPTPSKPIGTRGIKDVRADGQGKRKDTVRDRIEKNYSGNEQLLAPHRDYNARPFGNGPRIVGAIGRGGAFKASPCSAAARV